MSSTLKYHNSNRYCSVPQCKSRCKNGISLFMFPKDEKLKKDWANALKIRKTISKYMYVCSLHFLKDDFILPGIPTKRPRLKKGSIPSQNLSVRLVESKSINVEMKESSADRLFQSFPKAIKKSINMDAESDPLAITPADNLALFGGCIDNIEFVVESDEDDNDVDIKDDNIIEIIDSEEQDTEEVVERKRFLNVPCVTIVDDDIIDLDALDVKDEIEIAEMDLKPILEHHKIQYEIEAVDIKPFHDQNKKQCEIEQMNFNPIPGHKKQSERFVCEKLQNISQDGVHKIYCFVPDCTNEFSNPNCQNQDDKVYWFSVPTDANLRKIWGICIERSDKTLTERDMVCHKHFSEEDIVHQFTAPCNDKETVPYKPKLRQGAVPCIQFHDECCVPTCNRKTGKMYCFPVLRVSDFHLWIYMIKNPMLKTLKMKEVLRYRVCERHFDSDCFDGDVLLRSAAPTLYLPIGHEYTVDWEKAKSLTGTKTMNKAQSSIVLICAHGECPNRSNGEKNLFRFPKDTERCLEWLRACGRHSLITTPEATLREMSYLRLGVCEDHFDFKDFEATTAVLKPDAMPKLYDVEQSVDVRKSKAFSIDDKNRSGSSNVPMNVVEKNVVSSISRLPIPLAGVCAYTGCQSKESPDNTLFSFPLDSERSNKWLRASGQLRRKRNLINMKICSKHFDKDMFKDPHNLKDDAIPISYNLDEKRFDKKKTAAENSSTIESDQKTSEHSYSVTMELDADETAEQQHSESIRNPIIPCAVENCLNYYGTKQCIVNGKFPDPKKDPQRFNIWLRLIANPKLAHLSPEEIYTNYLVCLRHFEQHFYRNGDRANKISDEAVPTRNLTAESQWFLTSDYYTNRLQKYFDTLNSKDFPVDTTLEWKGDLIQDVEKFDEIKARCVLERDRIRFPGMGHYLYMGKTLNLNKRKISYNVYNCHSTGYGLNNDVEVGESIKIHTAIIIDDDDECERQVLQQLLDKRRKNL